VNETEIIDDYVATLGFSTLRGKWIAIDRTVAQSLLTVVLHKDLAYKMEAMTLDFASTAAKCFIDIFSKEARFFTNGTWLNDTAGWTPITNATFDAGVVAFDELQIGVLWVEDED